MKMFFAGLLAFIGIFTLFLLWASYPWSLGESRLSAEMTNIEPEGMVNTEDQPSVVKILTWNLGYLYGKGSEGPGYTFREKVFYEARLNGLVKEIQDWQPDVICLQEIDFESARSHGINQARYLAFKAGYPYVAEAVSWDAHYIPFPYWPVTNNFGRMRSGGAILSKYPILSHQVELLAKPASQPWWYNLFYLHRYFQTATIEFGDKKIQIVNLHLEAFDKKDRLLQVKKLVHKIKQEKVDVIVGDFNMVPLSATKRSKFFNEDNYENDSSYEEMLKSGYAEVIPDEIYSKDESLYFTFPAWKPDRRLDYIFYESNLKMMKAEILPSALSDHLPLKATFQISAPKFNPYSQ